jgi:hypothetical protein
VRSSREVGRIFSDAGVTIDEGVAAFTGMYPLWGRLSSASWPFIRFRALTRIGASVDLWAVQAFGGRPLYRLRRASPSDFAFLKRGRRFDRVALNGEKLLVPSADRIVTEGWTSL